MRRYDRANHKSPFYLPNGRVSEGRPDIHVLLNAREPHEAFTPKETSEYNRLSPSHRPETTGSSRRIAVNTAKSMGLPSSIVQAIQTNTQLGVTSPHKNIALPHNEPLLRPRPPTRVGIFRARDAALNARNIKLHAESQRNRQFETPKKSKSSTHSSSSLDGYDTYSEEHTKIPVLTMKYIDTDGEGDENMDGPASTQKSFTRVPVITDTADGVAPIVPSDSGVAAYVRVGVPVGDAFAVAVNVEREDWKQRTSASTEQNTAEFLSDHHTTQTISFHGDTNRTFSRTNSTLPPITRSPQASIAVPANFSSSQSLTSPAATTRTEFMNSQRLVTPSGRVIPSNIAVMDGPMHPNGLGPLSKSGYETNEANYTLTLDMPRVEFRHATSDLPTAAVTAAQSMLSQGKTLTVADLHQRRPPYLDRGPPLDVTFSCKEMKPQDFVNKLRKYSSANAPENTKRKAFVIGGPADWGSDNKETGTFDFIAKEKGVKYYVSDFTRPSRHSLRTPNRPVTQDARNVPTVLWRHAESQMHKTEAKLLDRVTAPPDETDSSLLLSHRHESLPNRRPMTSAASHLLPYANIDISTGRAKRLM